MMLVVVTGLRRWNDMRYEKNERKRLDGDEEEDEDDRNEPNEQWKQYIVMGKLVCIVWTNNGGLEATPAPTLFMSARNNHEESRK